MMTLIEVFNYLQLEIIREVISLLRLDDSDGRGWIGRKRGEAKEINQFIRRVLRRYNKQIEQALMNSSDEAYKEIERHIAVNWRPYRIQRTYREEARAVDYLNQFALTGLITRTRFLGSVERQIERLLNKIEALEDINQEAIDKLIEEEFELGLLSDYQDTRGYRWALDRYVREVEDHLIVAIYTSGLTGYLTSSNTELVRVPKFSNPRPACEGLQSGAGIICVVPRSQASPEAQAYPNIYDSQHKYGSPDGHHGINCRHTWTAVDNLDGRPTLYDRIDRLRREMWRYRRVRWQTVKRLLKAH